MLLLKTTSLKHKVQVFTWYKMPLCTQRILSSCEFTHTCLLDTDCRLDEQGLRLRLHWREHSDRQLHCVQHQHDHLGSSSVLRLQPAGTVLCRGHRLLLRPHGCPPGLPGRPQRSVSRLLASYRCVTVRVFPILLKVRTHVYSSDRMSFGQLRCASSSCHDIVSEFPPLI